MDLIGKNISICSREKCCAPKSKQPMKVWNITGICKYCTKRDNELSEEIKTFEIQESANIETSEKPTSIKIEKILSEREKKEIQRQKQRKEEKAREQKERRLGQVKNWQSKRKPTKVKAKTTKQSQIETAYRKIQEEIIQERKHCCEGCGRSDTHITFSHRIPRSRRRDLVAVKENIDLMCMSCHEKVEVGLYDELLNGKAIVDFLRMYDLEYYYLKFYKRHNSKSA